MRRKISMRPWLSACLVLLSSPALGQENPIIGTWCAVDVGETLYILADGIGFNEHTVCDAENPPADGDYATQISCRNVYVADGEVVEAFAETMAFHAELTSSDALLVTLRNETEQVAFGRCD